MRHYLIILLCVLVLCGCSYQIPLRQSVEEVGWIELIDQRNSADPVSSCTLTGEQAKFFLDDLSKLDCIKRTEPLEGFNSLEIRIYYNSGNFDFIGSGTNGYYEDGTLQISGWYYYHEEELKVLFSRYLH